MKEQNLLNRTFAKLHRASRANKALAVTAAIAVAATGLLIVATQAANFFATTDFNNASLSGTSRVDDNRASGGKALLFGAKEDPPTGTPPVTSATCISKPNSCGYPDATSAGVPADASLTNSGSLTVTQAGATISNLNIQGCVNIQAPNVTIKNSRISCSRSSATVKVVSGSVTIQDSEIDGGANGSGSCVGSGNYTLIRVNVHGCVDGARVNGNVVIRDSYFHTLKRVPDSHNDTLQTTQGSNILIEHNTLFPYNPGTGDPMNAAYIVGQSQGPISNVTLRNNLINGGNYTLYLDSGISNFTITNNVFGRDYRYGPISGAKSLVGPTNVYFDTRQAVNP